MNYGKKKVLAAYTYIAPLQWGLVAKVTTAEINRPYYEAIIIAALLPFYSYYWVFSFVKITNPFIQNILNKEKYYQSMFNNNYVCKLLFNPANGNIVDANPAACNFYGYEHKKFISMNISQISTSTPKEIMQQMSTIQPGKGYHFVIKHKLSDGTLRDVEVSNGLVKIKDKQLIYSIIFDITEHVMATEAMRKSEELLRTVLNNAPITMFATDSKGIFTLSEGKQLKLVNLKPGENVGLSAIDLYDSFPFVERQRKSNSRERCYSSCSGRRNSERLF